MHTHSSAVMAEDGQSSSHGKHVTNNGAAFLATEDSNPRSVTITGSQLSYIGQDSEEIPPEVLQYHAQPLSRIDLSFNRLHSLSGLERFRDLEELILDNNEIDDHTELPQLPGLHTLTLNKNNIKDLESLLNKVQRCLPSLSYLSLLGNQACPNQLSSYDKDEEDYQRYRYYVIHYLPKLKFLDSSAISVDERKQAMKRGKFLKVIKPEENENPNSAEDSSYSPSLYSPLPSEGGKLEGDHKGTFGKCKYVYYGRHSEGNRFIRNNDL